MIGRLIAAMGRRRARRAPPCGAVRESGKEREVIKGTAGNAIIVKSPDTEYFREAIFILRDDASARPGLSRSELLAEARTAAEGYCRPLVPERRRFPLRSALIFLAGAASGFVLHWAAAIIAA